MTLTETSFQAYYGAGRLSTKRTRQVLSFVRMNPDCTNEDISAGMHLPIQTVTPRTREAKANGLLWVTGVKRTRSGRSAVTHRVASCPDCMSEDLVREDLGGHTVFTYGCRNCGCTFRAHVGATQSTEALVTRIDREVSE